MKQMNIQQVADGPRRKRNGKRDTKKMEIKPESERIPTGTTAREGTKIEEAEHVARFVID